ncbi:hypothetical protein GCM10010289_77570 [Streptomyces violascens]|uniref:Transposase n=1 Tax=Streptomyces violascens TaxID=67381 RepID=A0ABQ3QKX2_9ACTN|nr:hypothetical protein GCM10010289_77570 [Streptomyces violascens]GHI37917.1 hypothetical protein Sviol_23250 [Streptomyces violascens]
MGPCSMVSWAGEPPEASAVSTRRSTSSRLSALRQTIDSTVVAVSAICRLVKPLKNGSVSSMA